MCACVRLCTCVGLRAFGEASPVPRSAPCPVSRPICCGHALAVGGCALFWTVAGRCEPLAGTGLPGLPEAVRLGAGGLGLGWRLFLWSV